ncbi:DNA methyltransferase [Candidatus Izimaplasma bacterium ZiA1]|uniref:MGMT family protein n=1 Tax=Candidatus Izimoplasma sp. ZiA1 TaxID=2024899 RepID=UPI000BAA6181|nr:DNA methyltransferase [Candidatus Izimaplasma bacterium ZiA1]
MQEFTEVVIKIIRSIPKGKVMTYGQIASIAGSPRSARQVSRILHSMSSKYDLPWQRVINSKGTISLDGQSGHIQKEMLLNEGLKVIGKSIDLKEYLYKP